MSKHKKAIYTNEAKRYLTELVDEHKDPHMRKTSGCSSAAGTARAP